MSQVLEWRELLESAHKQLQDAMTNLITNKNYSEAERRLHAVDQLMVDLIEDMGGNVIRSGLWT
jgi:wyosine [tRNA(Phe)-imidazoG37] synthetase (radical SAM superfamily)